MTDHMRIDFDSFGPIEVPAHVLWGAQTARSLRFFAIGDQCMPLEVVHALAWIKWASARINHELGLLDSQKALAIENAALQVASGDFDKEFPLSVWQTGSGTQTHMNVNEVIAHLASRALQHKDRPDTVINVHPHDDVNLGQSSNDTFPSAMHIAAADRVKSSLLPSLHGLRMAFAGKKDAFQNTVKLGRTHLQDATPLTLGQEFSGYQAQLALCEESIQFALRAVHALAIGGTAVGTGLNTHPQFGVRVTAILASKL